MVKETEINGLSTPPIKDYDIVPTIWNTPANVMVGKLLANPHYRNELLTAIHTMKNKETSENINQINTKTTALYMTVRLNGKRIQVIPNSRATVSIVSDDYQKLRFEDKTSTKIKLKRLQKPTRDVEENKNYFNDRRYQNASGTSCGGL